MTAFSAPAGYRVFRSRWSHALLQALALQCLAAPVAQATTVESIYWTGTGGKLQKANSDGSNVTTLVTNPPGVNLLGVALDSQGMQVYWAKDSPLPGGINRASLDGSGAVTLIAGLGDITSIALDLTTGKIYWADRFNDKIQRADLDGSQIEDLVLGVPGDARGSRDRAGWRRSTCVRAPDTGGAS